MAAINLRECPDRLTGLNAYIGIIGHQSKKRRPDSSVMSIGLSLKESRRYESQNTAADSQQNSIDGVVVPLSLRVRTRSVAAAFIRMKDQKSER